MIRTVAKRILVALMALLFARCAFAQTRPIVGPTVMTTLNPGVVPLTIKAAQSQVVDLQDWVDPFGHVLASVSATGVFSGNFTPPGLLPTGVVYTNSLGALTTSANLTYDPSVNNLTAETNLFLVGGQETVRGILQLGTGIEFLSDPSLGLSLAGDVRLRNNAGVLQMSQNGGAYTPVGALTGGTTFAITVWTGSTSIGALGVAANGQIPIGSTGGYPNVTNITAGTGIGVANGAGTITLTNTGVDAVIGTVHQITVSASTGVVTISGPQDLDVFSSPTFSDITIDNHLYAQMGVGLGPTRTTSIFESGSNTVDIYTDPNTVFRADNTNDATNTAILIYANGTLKRVIEGATNSCSSGYRCLAVAN